MSYGFFSRKNWKAAETEFVTVNSPLVAAGGLVTSVHVVGGVMVCVDGSAKPAAFVGEE